MQVLHLAQTTPKQTVTVLVLAESKSELQGPSTAGWDDPFKQEGHSLRYPFKQAVHE